MEHVRQSEGQSETTLRKHNRPMNTAVTRIIPTSTTGAQRLRHAVGNRALQTTLPLIVQRSTNDSTLRTVTTFASTPAPTGSITPEEVKHLIASTVTQRMLVDASSPYAEGSFMWWWHRGNYGAALNQLDRECRRVGAPIAKFISGIFEPTARNVEQAATGFDPLSKKPIDPLGRVLAGASAVFDILWSALEVSFKALPAIVKVIDKGGAIKKLGRAIAKQIYRMRPVGPFVDKQAAGDRRALPDATGVAPPYPRDTFYIDR